MTSVTSQTFLGVFLIFCRIGGCMLIVPGFSSSRIPAQIRLFIALAISLALAPLLLERIETGITGQTPTMTLWWIFTETLTGLLIGLLGRIFFLALQTILTAVSGAIGIGGIPGASIDDVEPMPAINTIIMMAATAFIFLADLQWELFQGLVASYSRIPPGEGVGTQLALIQIADQITNAFILALRVGSPFIVYSVIVNLAVGLANKLTPQIPLYFIATPFIMLGGLMLFYMLQGEFISLFMSGFVLWLRQG